MASKPVRVIVSLDRTRFLTPALFSGILAVARRRGWRLVDELADDADGRIADSDAPGEPDSRAVTVSPNPWSAADVRPDADAVERCVASHFLDRGFRTVHSIAGADKIEAVTAGGAGVPMAYLGRSDAIAARTSAAVLAAGRRVPGEVAVVGVGNDVLTCERSAVTLSSVDVGPARLGRAAAERLHRLLRGRPVAAVETLAPVAVIERESTATLALDDTDVAAAVRFIREHAAGPLRVGDILRASGLDRRTLERRFARHFGRSPAETVRRARVDVAAKLLRETTLPMSDVARASGFRLPQHMAVAFKAIVGQTPSDYRASMTAV